MAKNWSQPKKWFMGIAATLITLTIIGVIGYISGGALRAYANYDVLCVIKSDVAENKAEIKDSKEKTAKELSDINKRLSGIESAQQIMLNLMLKEKGKDK